MLNGIAFKMMQIFCDLHNTMAHSLEFQKSHRIVPINEKAVIKKKQAAKPMDCKNHHMPLCLYCLSCKVKKNLQFCIESFSLNFAKKSLKLRDAVFFVVFLNPQPNLFFS